MFSSASVSQAPVVPARLPAAGSEEKAEVIILEGDCFISTGHYSWVTEREQTTRDWIRLQDNISLNGVTLRVIVDNLRKERLKACIREFLYTDKNPPVILSHIAALKELATQFFGNANALQHFSARYEYDISDGFAVQLIEHLRSLFYNLDAEQKNGKPRYQFSQTPEMKALKVVIAHVGKCFSTEGVEISVGILENILKDYLLVDLATEQEKRDYIDVLFKVGHHGGFLFALFTAHLQHINKQDYLVQQSPCIEKAKIEISCDGQNIYIDDRTPIISLNSSQHPDQPIIANPGADPRVMLTHVKHLMKRGGDGTVTLEIVSAVDYSYNAAAKEVLVGAWLKQKTMFANYATLYVMTGHDTKLIKELCGSYPDILDQVTPRHFSFFKSPINQDAHPQGDKILTYLAQYSPSYAENLLARLGDFADFGQVHYTRAMRVLQRMGRDDLIQKALLPYLIDDDNGEMSFREGNLTDHDKKVEAGYDYLVQYGFLSSPSSANQALQERPASATTISYK